MITFKQFMGEAQIDQFTEDEIIHRIKRDCIGYLQAIDHDVLKYVSYRGMRTSSKYSLNERPRVRRPLHTPDDYHLIIDDFLKEKFHYPYRSESVFASGNIHTAQSFGVPHIIFPIGQAPLKYLWSKEFDDLFGLIDIYVHGNSFGRKPKFNNFKEALENAFSQESVGLKEALSTEQYCRHEVMYAIDEYYAIEIERGGYEQNFDFDHKTFLNKLQEAL